ncbi:MAG: hypothetical protein V7609_2073 [Verrucomicrobiota bacterium]
MFTRLQLLKAGLYTGLAMIPPITAVLASNTPLTARVIALLAFTSVGAGGLALKAFISEPTK